MLSMEKFFADVWKALDLPIVDVLDALIFGCLGTYIAAEFCGMSPDVPSIACAFCLFIGTDMWGSFLSKSFRKKGA